MSSYTAEQWGEIILWFVHRGTLIRHNFYHQNYSPRAVQAQQEFEYYQNYSPRAVQAQQEFEYQYGLVAWLEYRPQS